SRQLVLECLEQRTLFAASLNVLTTGDLIYTAGTGTANNLSVSLAGGNYTFRDTAEKITLTNTAKKANCSSVDNNTVTCPDSAVNTISLNVGDANDTVRVQSVGDATTVNGGTGTDTVASTNDADFILSNSSLSVSTFAPVVALVSIEAASLTGG